MSVPTDARARHDLAVARLAASYARHPADAPVRLAKKTSNLFRARARTDAPGLDVALLDRVLAVDAERAHRRRPGHVHLRAPRRGHAAARPRARWSCPQLKTITLGGAVTGLGIESTSFRSGLPHESVLEMDILTGAGEIVTARPEGEHADLFHGFPNSYGTLGYATRLRIELEPVEPVRRPAARAVPRPRVPASPRWAPSSTRASTTASGSTTSTAWSSRRPSPT